MTPLPDAALVADEIFAAGIDAVMNAPALARIRAKLSNQDIRQLVAVITEGTALVAARQLLAIRG